MKEKLSVFLGGTCGDSKWRDALAEKLQTNVDAFNPVVADWNEEAQKREDAHKANDDVNLFVITPATNSPYSLFEIALCVGEDKDRLVVAFLDEDNGRVHEPHMQKAVNKIKKDLTKRNVPCFDSLEALAEFLNGAANAKTGVTPGQMGEGNK